MGVFRRGTNWWIDYYFEGRRKREKIGLSHKLAQEVLHKRKAEIAERKFFPERMGQNLTFREMAEKYWNLHGKYCRSKSWKPMLEQIVQKMGSKKLVNILASDLQAFYNRKRETASASTANRYLTIIRSIFNKATKWGDFFGENPVNKVIQQREPEHRTRFLSREEISRFLPACAPKIHSIVVVAILTGMRRGEILNLRWEHVYLEQGIIHILQSKSGKMREVPISSKLNDILLGLNPKKEGTVFLVPIITLRRYFDKASRDAQIRDLTFHDLRHTFASHFIMKTSDLPALQKILGHASPAMTQRYAHLAKSHLASEMFLFDSAIPNIQPMTAVNGHPSSHSPAQVVDQESARRLER